MVMQIPPQFLAQNPSTGFQMPIPPGQNIVPYQAPHFTQGLGVPDAVTAGEPAAEALSRLAKLRMMAASPLGLAGLGLGAALYADPGAQKHFDPFLGINPNDEPNDLGITSIGKSAMRGAAHIGNKEADAIDYIGENSPLFNIPKWLLSTNAEKVAAAPQPEMNPISAGLSGDAITPTSSSQEFVMPGAGGSSSTPGALDDLMAVLAAERPTKTEIPEELKSSLRNYNLSEAAAKGSRDTLGGATKWSGILDLLAANNKSDLSSQLQSLQGEQQYNKSMTDWLDNYAKTGVAVAKEKDQAKKDDFKIHSTKDGFLIETTDKNGDKVLKPISPFGRSGGKIEITGRKFASDNPLREELGVLQKLGDIGALNDIMVEHNQDLMKATKGISDPKQMEDAKLLTLARAMHNNPNFKAALIQKYVSSMGSPPAGPTDTQPVYPDWEGQAPSADSEDFLTGLTK